MNAYAQNILFAVLGYFGGLSSVLITAWLTDRRADLVLRKGHRKELRETRKKLASNPGYLSAQGMFDDWWLTAVEDYGLIGRWRIERHIRKIEDFRILEPDWDVNLQSSATDVQRANYHEQWQKSKAEFLALIDRLIGMA